MHDPIIQTKKWKSTTFLGQKPMFVANFSLSSNHNATHQRLNMIENSNMEIFAIHSSKLINHNHHPISSLLFPSFNPSKIHSYLDFLVDLDFFSLVDFSSTLVHVYPLGMAKGSLCSCCCCCCPRTEELCRCCLLADWLLFRCNHVVDFDEDDEDDDEDGNDV